MNPFKDWKPEEQCRLEFAQLADGRRTYSSDPRAVKWCAVGRLFRIGLDDETYDAFRDWFRGKNPAGLMGANDSYGPGLHWTPAQFAVAWDEFEKERAQ